MICLHGVYLEGVCIERSLARGVCIGGGSALWGGIYLGGEAVGQGEVSAWVESAWGGGLIRGGLPRGGSAWMGVCLGATPVNRQIGVKTLPSLVVGNHVVKRLPIAVELWWAHQLCTKLF